MEFNIKHGVPEKQRTACLVLGVFEGRKLTPAATRVDQASDGGIAEILTKGDFTGKTGQSQWVYGLSGVSADRVLLVGCGKPAELDDRRYRQILTQGTQALAATGAANAVSYLAELAPKGRTLAWAVRQHGEASDHALYRFDRMKSKPADKRKLARLSLGLTDKQDVPAAEQALAVSQAIAAGVSLARDLGNLPANVCTPEYLAAQAKTIADADSRIKLTVLDRAQMEELGMGTLLAVAKGSEQPPKLIVMQYRNAGDAKPYALVGKGVTFDTGGISIKPAAEMDEMKYDMCGAASVLGTMSAVSRLGLPLNVVGVVAAVENMPDGRATRPGDVVTSMSGQTVEILNTDAEGRLILCDALTYTERFKPAAIVDIATLTGAVIIALGRHPHGLFSNDDTLANELLGAGERAVDRAWRLPLWEDYQSQLDSNFADMANIGGRDGGSITAACFLSRFTKGQRWAHLDIAGTAWKTGKEKGGTGRPVPLLTEWLLGAAGD